jgi:hypothetical protein
MLDEEINDDHGNEVDGGDLYEGKIGDRDSDVRDRDKAIIQIRSLPEEIEKQSLLGLLQSVKCRNIDFQRCRM